MYPTPWKVVFDRRCKEWHARSSPRIVDANGKLVLALPCFVAHPGLFDAKAIDLGSRIVEAINERDGLKHCYRKAMHGCFDMNCSLCDEP